MMRYDTQAVTVVSYVFFLAVLRGQSDAPLPPTVTLPPDLATVLSAYEKAYPKGGAALSPLFAEDGFVLAGGRPPIQGRSRIAEYYGTSRGALALRPFAYGMSGDIAFILGGYASRHGEPDAGKFTLTLRRDADGHWMIISDMDTGNSRPPRPPGALLGAVHIVECARGEGSSAKSDTDRHPGD